MMTQPIDTRVRAHLREIDKCNQRGGRMLSLVDLLAAGSVDLPLAAYLAATMRSGASLLVGARPGGAGKTAVMCALLTFLPNHTAIRAAENLAVLAQELDDDRPGQTCYLAHEIGNGRYYAYLWGMEARVFFELASRGHIIAANLHADTLAETRDQLCRENGVARTHLDAVRLKVYLRMMRTTGWRARRWVSHVYESDGSQDRLIFENQSGDAVSRQAGSSIVSPDQEQHYVEFLNSLLHQNINRIKEIREILMRDDQ